MGRFMNPQEKMLGTAHRIAITTGSSTLTAVTGGTASFPEALAGIGLVREAGMSAAQQIRFKLGASASATTSAQWPAAGYGYIPLTKAKAESIRVISASGTIYATMLVFPSRK